LPDSQIKEKCISPIRAGADQAHRLLYHSTLGLIVIKKKKKRGQEEEEEGPTMAR